MGAYTSDNVLLLDQKGTKGLWGPRKLRNFWGAEPLCENVRFANGETCQGAQIGEQVP